MHRFITSTAAAAALLAMPMAAHALVYQFNAGLSAANEVPTNASSATGVATLFYNDRNTVSTADDTYDFSMSVFGLTGPATSYHIHAPAPVGVNGPVLVSLDAAPFIHSISGGTLLVGGDDVAPPNGSFLSNLQAGLAYANVHTAAFPGGEMRGQLFQVAVVPEPATLSMLGAGLLSVLLWRRRMTSAG